jgi:hypothetical protein
MRALGELRRKPPLEAPKAQEPAPQQTSEPAPAAQDTSSFDESVVID